jgi:hypothetical protein
MLHSQTSTPRKVCIKEHKYNLTQHILQKSILAQHGYEAIEYKAVFKPMWTYVIQLWGTASTSNIEILERFNLKVLHVIVNVSWYMPNTVIQRDIQIPTVKKKSAITALSTVVTSAYAQTT